MSRGVVSPPHPRRCGGETMLYNSVKSLSHHFLNSGNDAFGTGDVELFQRRTKWHWRMRCRYQFDGRVEFAEALVGNQCGNVCGGTAARVILVNNHEAVRLGDRAKDRLLIQWGKCAWINYLYRNAVGLQHICRCERLVNHTRNRHNRDIRALA